MQASAFSITKEKQIDPRNGELVRKLQKQGVIHSERVAAVMNSIDRGDFVDPSDMHVAYMDFPHSIQFGATISAPHMHAYALEILEGCLKPGGRVLDVGAGSGYLTICFLKMMENSGVVYGIEHIGELVDKAKDNLRKSFSDDLENGKIVIVEGDGREGLKSQAPFDCIHVGAAAPKMPQALIDQLAPGGKMMIPVGEYDQEIVIVEKSLDGKVSKKETLGVRYVPLTSKDKQWPGTR